MKQFLILLCLATACFASKCSSYTTCTDCNKAVDSDGSQLCKWCISSRSCVSDSAFSCVFGHKISDINDCPIPIANDKMYTETFVKNYMLPLSSAAYSDEPQKCLTNVFHGAKLVKQVTVHCDSSEKDFCSGFIAYSSALKTILLGFRGSAGTVQLLLEATESVFGKKKPVAGGGKASEYFYNAFNDIWQNGIMEELLGLRQAYPDYEIWVSGHSLGGSLAAIASNVIVATGIAKGDQIKVVTFGEPRTGDNDFAAAHDKMLPFTYRLTHAHDMVPHLPTEGYSHYHHHRYEVWYNNDMNPNDDYIICLTPEDVDCSNSNTLDLSIDDHTHYFGKSVSAFGQQGCIGNTD